MDYIISFFTSTIVPILAFFGISFSVPEVVIPGNIPNPQTVETATQNALNEFTRSMWGEGEESESREVSEGEASGQ